jgi:hypothetical protein
MSGFEDSNTDDFDIDAGVADIAESMGFGGDNEDFNDDGLQDESKPEETQDEESEYDKLVEDTEEQAIQEREAPASWSKEQHENWTKIPREAQDYIELRQKQMLDGIEQYKQGHQQAAEMQRVIEPFRESLLKHGVSETQAIQNLFGHHMALTEGSTESRQAAFVALGQNLGLIPQEGQAQVDPRTQELQQRIDRIEQQERQREQHLQQQNYSKIEQEVNNFAADPANVYFDEVADDVVMLLKSGLDLQQAYEKAVWANPITRAKELSKSVTEQTQAIINKKAEAAKAAKKASSSNIRPVNTSRISNQPAKSWDDSMNASYDKINNQ